MESSVFATIVFEIEKSSPYFKQPKIVFTAQYINESEIKFMECIVFKIHDHKKIFFGWKFPSELSLAFCSQVQIVMMKTIDL